MGKCLDRLTAVTPREFWVEIAEAADAAFGEAARLTDKYVDDPERSNMLGQFRHARLEFGLRRSADAHNLVVASPHTTPKGGRYSIVSAEGIHIIRGNVQCHRGPPRPTRFRQQIASSNRWLSPLQPDFYMTVPEPAADRLCAVLVVTAQRRGNPRLPAWVGVGFPHHDLKSWAEIQSLSDILAAYHDADTEKRADQQPVVEFKDIAVPRLKKKNGGS